MPSWGVDYGGSANLFNMGQSVGQSLGSLFSGATELKRATAEANINRLNARTRLDDQEYDARNGLGQANYDSWVKAHPQGASNANPSGAAPVVVEDPNAQRARFGGVLATSANDAATAYNTQTGGYLVQNGGPNEMRRGAALMGHLPTNNTVLGPDDTAGTNATIRINDANLQNDIAKDRAKTDYEIQKGLKTPDPLAHPLSVIDELSKKKREHPDQWTVDDQSRLDLLVDKEFPPQKIDYKDPVTGQPFVRTSRENQPTFSGGGNPAPVPVPPAPMPGANGATPRSAAPKTSTPAPAPITSSGAPVPPAPAPNVTPPAQPQTAPRMSAPIPLTDPGPVNKDIGQMRFRAQSMIGAESGLNSLPPNDLPGIIDQIASNTENGEAIISMFAKQYAKDPRYATFMNAASVVLTDILRDESGAAIGSSEFLRRARELIPFAGDPPDLQMRKRTERTRMMYRYIDAGWGENDPVRRQAEQKLSESGYGRDKINDFSITDPNAGQRGAPVSGKKRWVVGPDGSPLMVGGE